MRRMRVEDRLREFGLGHWGEGRPRAVLVRMLREGMTIEGAAELLGVTARALRRAARRLGVKPLRPGRPTVLGAEEARRAGARSELDLLRKSEALSHDALASRLGCSPKTVQRRRRSLISGDALSRWRSGAAVPAGSAGTAISSRARVVSYAWAVALRRVGRVESSGEVRISRSSCRLLVLTGSLDHVERRARDLRMSADREKVVVAFRDPGGDDRVFTLAAYSRSGCWRSGRILARCLLQAGVREVVVETDRLRCVILARGPEEAAAVRGASVALSMEWMSRLEETPARIGVVEAGKVDRLPAGGAPQGGSPVVADVLVYSKEGCKPASRRPRRRRRCRPRTPPMGNREVLEKVRAHVALGEALVREGS